MSEWEGKWEGRGEELRAAMLHALGEAMSEVSEECWCAGWLIGTEEDVPRLAREAVRTGQPTHWGQCEIDLDTARRLCVMADALGCWATLGPALRPMYVEHVPACDRAPNAPVPA